MLRNLTTSLSRADASGPGSVSATPRTYTSPSVVESSTAYEESSFDGENDRAFEGTSSMTAHTVFASEFLEQAVTSTTLTRRLNPDIQNALASLQQMVHMQNRKGVSHESRFVHQKAVPKGGFSQLPLPPTDIVLNLLREIKGESAVPQGHSWSATECASNLTRRSRTVYDIHDELRIHHRRGLYRVLSEGILRHRRLQHCHLHYCECRSILSLP